MARQHAGMRLPNGYGGGAGGRVIKVTEPPLSNFSPLPPCNAIQKLLSSGEHLNVHEAANTKSPWQLAPMPFPSYPFSGNAMNHFKYPAHPDWLQELLPASREHFRQHVALNGGSLVLDTERGELVNAPKMTPKEILEAKALAASKSHSEAERRRRERINSHLSTLRNLLPCTIKTDKASLLAEVIDQLKTLKRQVSEAYEYESLPSDRDGLCVEMDHRSAEKVVHIRATICCSDRRDLMTELKHAIDNLRLKLLKTEISTLGGRIKIAFIMTMKDGDGDQDISTKHVQEVLQLVMDGRGGGELSPSTSNKRQRVAPSRTEMPIPSTSQYSELDLHDV